MSSVPGARLERSVNIREAVRVAIHEAVNGQVVFVGEQANEPPGGARRHAAHFDDNAIRGLPKPMIVQPLEHAAGFNGENKTRIGPKAQMLHRTRDAISSASEVCAVNLIGSPVAVFRSITVSRPATEPPCDSG